MNNFRFSKDFALEISEFCLEEKTEHQIKKNFLNIYSFSTIHHLIFLQQMKIPKNDMFGLGSYQTVMPKKDIILFFDKIILCERGRIVYIRDDKYIGNFRQQSSTIKEMTLPNPKEIDLVRFALSKILEDIPSIEIATKCNIPKPDVSHLKSMKRAVSLEKALEIVSQVNGSEKFLHLMYRLMEKKIAMMK